MNPSQQALLERLNVLVEETPRCGAVNAAGNPHRLTRFAQAVEARGDDGEALVTYLRGKVRAALTGRHEPAVVAGRPDLTVEAVVADADAAWASEFTDEDREAARTRLDAMVQAHQDAEDAVEAAAVTHDRKVIDDIDARRKASGKPPLTPEQREDVLARRGERRAVER